MLTTRSTLLLALLVAAPAVGSPVGPDPTRSASFDPGRRARARRALIKDIERAVTAAGFEDARVGISIFSITDGTEIYARDADDLLNPASNMKLVTAAAALELLGPEFRYETEFYADAEPDDKGVIRGNVYLKGKGDPTFVSERMFRLVTDLRHMGIKRITGDIVVDDTYFDSQREGPGWEQEVSDRAYIAPTGAVSLNFNAVAIHVRPGAKAGDPAIVTVDPDSDYFVIENKVVTSPARSRRRHFPASIGAGKRQRIQVRGRQPVDRDPAVYYRRIDNPPYYFAHTFKKYMQRQGIRFNRGRIRVGPVKHNAVLLRRSLSKPLSTIIVGMNKVSQNHIAEQLLKTMGAEVVGAPGSWPKGVAAVEHYLETEVGISRGSYVMKNGSGLNDTNRFSARQLTKLLAHVWNHFQVAPEFVSSLSVAGRDGTAKYRLDGTVGDGTLRVKTGTLENVSALSGYAATAAGEILAFSVIVNDHPGSYSTIVDGVDRIAEAIAGYGLPSGHHPPAVVVAPEAIRAKSADESSRVSTYLLLGRAKDNRNVRFLRSALRTESSPLVRAVVAEAIYLSDPSAGRRVLIDNFVPTETLVGGLRGLSHHEGVSTTPVLTSLADLAAEGNDAAMEKLVKVVQLGMDDAGLRDELSVILLDVGSTAPEELLEALLGTDAASADQVIETMADGLRQRGAEHHPFRRLLQRGSGDEPRSEEAVRLAELFEARLSAVIDSAQTGSPPHAREGTPAPGGPAKGGGSP